jgi:hypothetical protein
MFCFILRQWDANGLSSVKTETGDSVYLFYAAKNPIGIVIAMLTIGLQMRILSLFITDEVTRKTGDSVWNALPSLLAILIGTMAPEMVGAIRILVSGGPASVTLTGFVMLLVNSFNFVVTFVYGLQSSDSMAQAVLDVGVLCFVSTLDEQIFHCVGKLAPTWVEKVKEDADQALKTATAHGSPAPLIEVDEEEDEGLPRLLTQEPVSPTTGHKRLSTGRRVSYSS